MRYSQDQHDNTELATSPLGQANQYQSYYTPELLYPLKRQPKRDEIQVPQPLPFTGYDIWNSYELSWLNHRGKPQVAIAQFIFPCESSHIIESKSFKQYLNSYNNSCFDGRNKVRQTLQNDLTRALGTSADVRLYDLQSFHQCQMRLFDGVCLDKLDITCRYYTVNPDLLTADNDNWVTETVTSELLKSNCLVTGQPDWGSLQVSYSGPKIDQAGLLQYIVSYRNHNEFHEQCVERIFMDIYNRCRPRTLTVYARYTRRGGLDINPVRSTDDINVEQLNQSRTPRQ